MEQGAESRRHTAEGKRRPGTAALHSKNSWRASSLSAVVDPRESPGSGLRFQLSALRFPVSCLRSQVSALRFPVSSLRFPVSCLRSQLSSLRFALRAVEARVNRSLWS